MSAVVIHGHFYQPPRENPWTGSIDREPSAHPFHDWNERIHHECYRANAFARILDERGRIERIVNNYEHISFNFGATLLSWLEAYDPTTYARILAADRISVEYHGGHGNAIAQAYHHVILPLSSERDRITEVRWGLYDFRHRYGRPAEALWLPETACNDATLGVLIDAGLRYVILSPYQAERIRPLVSDAAAQPPVIQAEPALLGDAAAEDEGWVSVVDGIDPSRPYRYFHRDGSGRSLDVFFYDGVLSQSIAFEGALGSSQALVGRLGTASNEGTNPLVHAATDGETYGHHYSFGDRTLAYALTVEAQRHGLTVTNYGEYLERNPPTHEVELKTGPNGEGTAWSCAHGVGRWVRDCGCHTGAQDGWNQRWRTPLRQALDLVRDEAALRFADTQGQLFVDPWAARDSYIQLILDRQRTPDAWLTRHGARLTSEQARTHALTHLEVQRNLLRMYTSCGWFFADLSGLETVQILKYAGRAMDLMEELGLPSPRDGFLDVLAQARSNAMAHDTGADIYRRQVERLRVSPRRVAVHLAMAGLATPPAGDETGELGGYHFVRSSVQHQQHGRLTLTTARLQLRASATERRHDLAVAALHFGGVDVYGAVRDFPGRHVFRGATSKLWRDFRSRSLAMTLRLIQDEFGPEEYGLDTILPVGRERISEMILGGILRDLEHQAMRFYETHQRTLDMLQQAGFDMPTELLGAVQFIVGRRLQQAIDAAHVSEDPIAYERVLGIVEEAEQHGYRIDRSFISQALGERIADAVAAGLVDLSAAKLRNAAALVHLARRLGAVEHLGRAQELLYGAFVARTAWPEEARRLALGLGFSPSFAGVADDS